MRKSLHAEVIEMVNEFLQEFDLLFIVQKLLLDNGIVETDERALGWAAQKLAENKNALVRIFGFDPEEYERNIFKQRAEDRYWALKNDRKLISSQNLIQYHTLLTKLAEESIDKDIQFLFRNYQYERGESFSSFENSEQENSGFSIKTPKKEQEHDDDSDYEELKFSDLRDKVQPLVKQRRIEIYRTLTKEKEELSPAIEYDIIKVYYALLLQYMYAKEDGNYSLIEDILLPQIEAVEYSYPFVLEEYNRYE